MRIQLTAFFVLFFLATSLTYAEKPHYIVKRTTGRILIDGVLDEADWEAALPAGKFHFRADQDSTPVERTEVKLLWDDEFLYIAFKCEDSQLSASVFNSNAAVSADDCVEFFWIPGTQDSLFYQFEISSTGTTLAVYRHKRTRGGAVYLMPPHIGQTFQGTVNDHSDVDKGYTMEIALRFSDYPHIPYIERIEDIESFLSTLHTAFPKQQPKAGDTWRANFNRVNKFADGRRTSSLWSPNVLTHKWDPADPKPFTGSWFHCPHDFGYLHFSSEPVR